MCVYCCIYLFVLYYTEHVYIMKKQDIAIMS